MDVVEYNGKEYPKLQTEWFAAKFAFPFAEKFLKGNGYDIGCHKKEWAFPNSMAWDIELDTNQDAMNLPDIKVDYVFSSHMIEHYVGRFQDVIKHWLTRLRDGGVIFLYLPNMDYQKYWAFGNKKHIHYFNPDIMRQYCENLKYDLVIKKFIVTEGYDLNGSFYCVIEK